MIQVTRLNHEPIVVNADLIEYVETTPDTVISLTTGEKLMVLDTPEQVVGMVIDYQRLIHQSLDRRPSANNLQSIDEGQPRVESA